MNMFSYVGCSLLGGALLLGSLIPANLSAEPPNAPAQAKKKRVLFITESKGFVHSVVNRGKAPLALAEQVLTEIGEKSGDFEVVCSQDSRKMITKENLDTFDAVFFYTTGTLPLSETQKADLLDFVRKGGGFGGTHSATDTFYNWPEYGKLIGGYFDGHPWHQKIRVIVEDKTHPATKHLGDSFEITDEIYQFRTPYDRGRLRVLMSMDRAVDRPQISEKGKEVTLTVKNGVASLNVDGAPKPASGFRYDGPRGKRSDGDNALAWVQQYGKGRTFYTALGHREEVWKDERFQKHLLGGLRFLLGLEDGSTEPSKR
jgi:type 1 glutamine amidotransferase